MDDKSNFSSFIFSFFKPFIFTHRKENLYPENDDQYDEYNQPTVTPETSPRDSFLKPKQKNKFQNPYSNREGNQNTFFDDFGSSPFEHFGNPDRGENIFGDFSPGFHDDGFESIFRMMDEMFGHSSHFHFGPFGDEGGYGGGQNFPNFPNFPGVPSIQPRTNKEGKKDEDLDSASGKEIASLLKETPTYENKPKFPSVMDPSMLPPPSASTSRFKSTSIVRIRRPDGVIEETRKYRDSDGREETEIITREPGPEENLQTFDPSSDPSFAGIFKRFPFSIF